MNKIGDLINKFCPNGVIYKKLGDLVKIEKGKQLNKTQLFDEYEDGLYPVINGGIAPSGYWNEYNYNENLITISQGGASAGYVNYVETKFWAGAHCYVVAEVEDKIRYRYIYHFLKSKEKELQNSQVGAGIPSVSLKDINNLKVAVPPLEVQDEIVRILDDFTSLLSELSLELTARNQQYDFYKDDLLKPKKDYKKIKMKDVCSIITKQTGFDYSSTIKPSLVQTNSDENLSFIQNKDFNGRSFNYNTDYYIPKTVAAKYPKITLDQPSILFSISGKIGNVGLFMNKEKAFIGGAICICKLKEKIDLLPEYILHYSQSKYGQKYLFKNIKAASHLNITVEAIRDLEIYYPSIEEQSRIINILNNFDTLCNDTFEGIPAEIEKRQKQYEYYRDKLLNLKEVKTDE